MKKYLSIIVVFLCLVKISMASETAKFTICSNISCDLHWSMNEIDMDTEMGELCRLMDEFDCYSDMADTSCDDKFINGEISGFSEEGQLYELEIKATGCGKVYFDSFNLKAGETVHFILDRSKSVFVDMECCDEKCSYCEEYFKPLCAASMLLKDDPGEIDLLYKFRDRLQKTIQGKKYIELYYNISPQLIPIFNNNKALFDQARSILKNMLPVIKNSINKR
jgi:hypothetical protein